MDEVGRGSLAGPVSVGVVIVDARTRTAPVGLRDSKLLSAAAREALVHPVRRWGVAYGVGHAEPAEIDRWGIMTGLRLAGRRALAAAAVEPDLVVLDGNHDWLTDPAQMGLFADLDNDQGGPIDGPALDPTPPVTTVIKGDMTCSSVAAASILAKVERDAMMHELHAGAPEYEWAINKGYATAAHRDALRRLGPTDQHRRSWNLTGAQHMDRPPRPASPSNALRGVEWDMMGEPMRDVGDEKG